jgi:hypothetical protein
MRAHVLGIDHVVILVRDLDASRDDFVRMGFTLSPRGTHSPHMGTGNYTIMLERDYFELLGVVAPTEANAKWRDLVAKREGVSAVALKTDAAAKAVAEMRAIGIAAAEPVHFSRPVDLPGGQKVEAAFNTTQFPPEATPGARMFCCQHLTMSNAWVPALMRHANGARALAEVLMVADDPAATAAAYARIFDRGSQQIAGGVAVATGTAPLVVLTPRALAERYPDAGVGAIPSPAIAGFVITVGDREKARAALAAGGAKFTEAGTSLVVGPSAARGAVVELRPA